MFLILLLLSGTQSKNSPISVEDGYTWLIRLGTDLTHTIERRKMGDTSVTCLRCQECCTAFYLYLRQGSAALTARFGWTSVLTILQAIRTVVTNTGINSGSVNGKQNIALSESESGKQLMSWIDASISSNGVKCGERLKHHEPHVMGSYMIIRSPCHLLISLFFFLMSLFLFLMSLIWHFFLFSVNFFCWFCL